MPSTAAATAAPVVFEIDVEDIEYRRHGDKPLLMRLYRPRGAGPFPLMIDVHGGAWCGQDRTNDKVLNEAIARTGVMVAALDFRMPPDGGYPASLADINYAVRWLKMRAPSLKARPERIGAIGISSGGHQALLMGMRPSDPRYAALPLAGGERVDARLACVVMCWPVVDPLGRYRYAKALQAQGGIYPEQIDRVLPQHDRYWGSEAAMDEGAPATALEKGEAVDLPPVLYVQGAEDKVHPRANLDRFVAAYRKRGGQVDLALYEGEIDGFVVRNTVNPANAKDAMARIITFVHRHLDGGKAAAM